ncbi:AMP-binding enzyme domain-containing protein [Trichoderma breve]|uniref:AMP-binding enzyme domain-containing protein n=1 Tax=Trichoderma breve TaxID=2034170 RepID=A0A9W9E3S5_9HYPO|nr:AMP-binding enzyme domain-containing protein [Trichoderma breve]KAJ4856115.1 AMP-binding enzyme domain-containing protein [Trichoderma breve]
MGLLESLDAGITGFVGQWDAYSTGLVTLLVVLVTYRITSSREPDVHPLLLARQAGASTVRNEGESAAYRCLAAPHSMPLNSGLDVKDPGASRWARGRDGDLRDIWRKAATGNDEGKKGKLLTVLGSENVIEHRLEDITRQINLIGHYIAEQGGIRVAIYLPNSVEFLVTLLACSFYPNLTTVLIPFNVSNEELVSMMRRSAVDTVVTTPGSFPLDDVAKAYPSLRQLIWVVDEGSSHLDWNEVPEGMGGSVNVATWQEIIRDAPADSGTELPPLNLEKVPMDVVTFWQTKPGQLEEMVRFTQANLVAGIASQINAVPIKERLTPSDLFLPAESLAGIHTLALTLAALYQNSSVAFNSVAGRSPDLVLATQGIAPTVIVASPSSLLKIQEESTAKLNTPLAKASHAMSTRALTQQGVLPSSNLLSAFAAGAKPSIGTDLSKLRLVYTAERVGADTPYLSSKVLSDLRVFTGARVVYALTSARVVGAVSQTAYYDYRVEEGDSGHFGAPATSIEIRLKDKGSFKTTDDEVVGEIFATGPSVAGGETNLGVVGKLRHDNTLAYVS